MEGAVKSQCSTCPRSTGLLRRLNHMLGRRASSLRYEFFLRASPSKWREEEKRLRCPPPEHGDCEVKLKPLTLVHITGRLRPSRPR
jgi:hypothetical protein